MDINFNKNEDHNKLLISDLTKRLSQVKLGGGKTRIAKHHAKGKMTARERIDYLLDAKSKRIEIGAFAGDKMYEIHGGCPSGGIKIHPEQLESKLVRYINTDFFIASQDNPILGEEVILVIEGEEQKLPSDIFDLLNKHEVPKGIIFIKAFKRTISGKINRAQTLASAKK